MSEIAFYRYKGDIGPILIAYLEQVRANGMRAHIRCPDAKRVQSLENELWKQYGSRFIGIGAAGGEHDADQPVLLSTSDTLKNDPECLIAIGTAITSTESFDRFRKVAILFSTDIDSETAHARTLWQTFETAGLPLRYYSQIKESWELKQTRNC